jgi:hypothetical protein
VLSTATFRLSLVFWFVQSHAPPRAALGSRRAAAGQWLICGALAFGQSGPTLGGSGSAAQDRVYLTCNLGGIS